MNARCQFDFKNFPKKTHFRACAKTLFLLQEKTEAAMASFRGGEVFAFTSLFERWLNSTHSQAGVFLPLLFGGPCDPIHCVIGSQEPQDTVFNKFEERDRLGVIA